MKQYLKPGFLSSSSLLKIEIVKYVFLNYRNGCFE